MSEIIIKCDCGKEMSFNPEEDFEYLLKKVNQLKKEVRVLKLKTEGI